MKKFLILIVFLLFLIFDNVKSYEHWLREDWKLLPVIHINGIFKLQSAYCDFFFINSTNGLMSESGGVQGANIFKTTDGGFSWNYVLKDSIFWKDGKHEYVPAKPSRFDAINGLAVIGTKNQTTVLKTFSKDSGMVWISMDNGTTWAKNYTGLKTGINDVKVLKNGTIMVMSKNYIAKSLDTGKTWNKSTEFPIGIYDTTIIVNPIDTSIKHMEIWEPILIENKDSDNIFVFAIRNYEEIKNKLLSSSDGGISWKYNELPVEKKIADIGLTWDNKLWITGSYKKNDTGMTYIFVDYSTDNGDTWNNSLDTVFTDRWSESPVSRIKFYDNLNGAIVGDFGTFMRTADGGKSWYDEIRKGKKPDTMIYGSFTNFEYKSKDTIVLYDFGNFLNARLIWAPLLVIPTDIEEIVNINKDYLIYPNPANDIITISFPENYNHTLQGVVENGHIKVQIFNTLGIKVSFDGGGVNEVDGGGYRIDISNLPEGVYFVKILGSNGACSIVEKFVKM